MSKKYFLLLITLIGLLHISCKFCIDKNANPKITFYTRNFSHGNGDTTYYDDLKISNYREGAFSVNELFQIAHSYLDTVNSKWRIGGVTLFGEPPCNTMPTPNSWTIEEFKLISFGFSNKNDPIQLTSLAYWENGKITILVNQIEAERKAIDSLMSTTNKFRRK